MEMGSDWTHVSSAGVLDVTVEGFFDFRCGGGRGLAITEKVVESIGCR